MNFQNLKIAQLRRVLAQLGHQAPVSKMRRDDLVKEIKAYEDALRVGMLHAYGPHGAAHVGEQNIGQDVAAKLREEFSEQKDWTDAMRSMYYGMLVELDIEQPQMFRVYQGNFSFDAVEVYGRCESCGETGKGSFMIDLGESEDSEQEVHCRSCLQALGVHIEAV